MIVISSFYKYVKIDNPEQFQKEHLEYCKKLEIKGKILVSSEGINGTISSDEDKIKKYEKRLNSLKFFSSIKFKHTKSENHPFKKIIVRIRKEIVTSGLDVNIKNSGKHISPKKLKKMLDNNEEVFMLDVRNNYESKIGKFKNAITPNINNFRQFKDIINDLKKFKYKKIIMYCTGGIRCEKSSAYLIEKGFKDVNQIDGGIINFIQNFPDTYFEGRCFVFDDRLSIPTGKKTKDLSFCELCHIPSGRYINCKNISCDRMFICCEECDMNYKHFCSKACNKIKN